MTRAMKETVLTDLLQDSELDMQVVSVESDCNDEWEVRLRFSDAQKLKSQTAQENDDWSRSTLYDRIVELSTGDLEPDETDIIHG